MREPAFWWRTAGLAAALLAPAAALYGTAAERRMARRGTQAGVPVICAGNFTLGGTGKTPTAIMLAKMLAEAGERPFCLSRGYGGSEPGPKLVEPKSDSAAQVGDEALLLARSAPTVIARERTAGAALAKARGASVIVMDDGLQNASLAKNWTLAVIDGRRGTGNGRVFPAGPLRAPLEAQLARCDALLVVGDGEAAREVTTRTPSLPVYHGRLTPDLSALGDLKARNLFAFAGIGDAEKFFATARAAGLALARCQAFPDHHRFTAEESAALITQAEHEGLALLTTEKDRARMTGDPRNEALAARVHVLPVRMEIREAGALRAAVLKAVQR
jgi:tetraacyldisaccharide 4'-kinase